MFSFPLTFSEVGAKLLGLNTDVVSVPAIVAFPATVKFPPSVRPKAEMLLPDVPDERSGGRITSGIVTVPLMPWPLNCSW